MKRQNQYSMPQPAILIVDDDSLWRGLLVRLFTSRGYALLTAASCASGIKTAKMNKPDCVVLDFNLGDGNATIVCAALRAQGERRTPIIIFSSDPGAEECVVRDRLADKFILKTEPLEKLLSAVDELLAAHKIAPGQ